MRNNTLNLACDRDFMNTWNEMSQLVGKEKVIQVEKEYEQKRPIYKITTEI